MIFSSFSMLKKRADFLRIAKSGKRYYSEHFLVQALPNDELSGIFRVGYVATRKTGNAVKRNKIKRRLRALVYEYKDRFIFGYDYVFVARNSLWSVKFEMLHKDFGNVLERITKTYLSSSYSSVNGDSSVISTDN